MQVDWNAVEQERAVVDDAAERGRSDSPATAALTVLAGALELTEKRNRPALLPWCGMHRALIDDCATYLDRLIIKQELIEASTKGGGGG